MSNRHSFLSTTGLLRSSSSASNASFTPSAYGSSKAAKATPTLQTEKPTGRLQRLKNLKELKLSSDISPKSHSTGGIIPLDPTFIVGMAIVMSLCFVGVISFAFIGAEDTPVFKDVLNGLAQTSPGVSGAGHDDLQTY